MQEDTVLQRFRQLKATFISSNMPNSTLLELIESFITSDNDNMAVEIPVLDGHLSLFDTAT